MGKIHKSQFVAFSVCFRFFFLAPRELLLMHVVFYVQGSVTVVLSNCGRKNRPNGDPKEYQRTASVGAHVATYPSEGNAVR